MQSSKPSECFGGLRGCAGHGELGRGSPARRSLPPRGTVVVKANKVCSEHCGVFQGDETGVMLRDEIV